MQKSVNSFGATFEVPQALQVMNNFLFPSLFEGLSAVCLETQVAGFPVLISNTSAKEVGITGFAYCYSLEKSCKGRANKVIGITKNNAIGRNTSQGI